MKMVTIRHIAKKTITITGHTLLFLLEKTDDLIFELNHPSLTELMGIEGARRYLKSRYQCYSYPINRLKQNNLITIKREGDKIIVKLTEGGKIAALQLKIAKQKQRLADKTELILIFDIPEAAKNTRKAFRDSLKRMGFYRIQYSVWGIRYDVTGDLERYIEVLKIKRWVSIYMARKVK
jgi:hypothetical protein